MTFANESERLTAEKLGFKPPAPPPDRSAQSTFVVGYWNGNLWPVAFTINELGGIPVQLRQRGDFVTYGGAKINDPILEKFCGPGMLSKELSKTAVPVVRFPARDFQPSTGSGITASSVMPAAGLSPAKTTPLPPTPVSSPSVAAMDIATAKSLGLVRPTRPVEEGIPDTAGVPIRGDQTPDLDTQTAEDLGPKIRLKPTRLAAAVPETPAQAEMLERLTAAAEAPDTIPGLPQPNMTQPVTAAPEAPKNACQLCGKSFDFPSLLKRHLMQRHADALPAALPAHGLAGS